MTDVERLALMQALYKVLAEEVSTNKAGNTRDRVNEHYRELYEQTGATGFEVRLNGKKVGTYGFNKVKGQPERTVTELRVTDVAALRADESDEFNDWLTAWLNDHLTELAVQYSQETGELLDGMEYVTTTTPATPDTIRPNGTLCIDAAKVAAAMGASLGPAVAGLLIGGE